MSAVAAALVGWAVMAAVMTAGWIYQRARRNAGVVDLLWSLGTGLMGVWFAWVAEGDPARRVLVGGIAGLWGLRLGLHLARRVFGEAEDVRYRKLRAMWGPRADVYLFLFFQLQASWTVLFALPMLAAASNPAPGPRILDLAGLLIWAIAVAGEAIADRQLARFRANPANRGQVCREGLWRYSRHPNYFFEWVHWWAYVPLGLGGHWGWLTLAGPALMLFFLLKITGIPPTEARALESRPEAYREYQRTTSAFFPWPPRRGGSR